MHSEFVDETELQKVAGQVLVQGHRILEKLTAATANERQAILIAYIQELIAQAIGISASELDVQQPLNFMGIDSLIAVKLRNQLRTDLEVDLSAVKLMDDSSVASLAMQLNEQLLAEDQEYFKPKVMSNDDWLEGEI